MFQVLVEFNRDFIEIQGNTIRIGVRAKPLKGQANKEIIKKIAKHFAVSSSHVKIVSGLKSNVKSIEITT